MAIQSTSLTTTPQAISPSLATDAAITVMFFCNLNTPDPLDALVGKLYLDIFVVKSGDVYGNDNKIANQIPLDAGDTFTFNAERLVLSSNDRIYASATEDNKVSVTISYVVI